MLKDKYTSSHRGTLSCAADGEAWRLLWEKGEPGGVQMEGVGIVLDGKVFAARSERSSSPFASPGIVVYEKDSNGELPARWYHTDLRGRLGKGRSLGGPSDGYVGFYRAEYASSDQSFDPLIKVISRQGEAYRFAWRTDNETIYVGIGVELGSNLIAAWSTPRANLDVLIYDLCSASIGLSGTYVSYADKSGIASEENWFLGQGRGS